ncbi:uncharacterized protein MKZ38_003041 [Zalerion maritima]|uniref:Uncharacterized protein n=1 Tax=Zalerion maritima TaxID=339359 RepID=A0AAD5WS18_9PEZI|nr:uncharacterized protein MKZ38_003041 [Zalerion maritima]
MRFTPLLSAGLAAATPIIGPLADSVPSEHEVEIVSISFAGSGCPAGTVAGQLSSDLTTITLLFSEYTAMAGEGVFPTEYRKNCQLNVKLQYPQGWQYSVFKADYRGYAYIPEGDTGTCKATYYFSGQTDQITSTMVIQGPFDDNYIKTDQFGLESTVWSPCGQEGLLNINSEVRISPLDQTLPALMTVNAWPFPGGENAPDGNENSIDAGKLATNKGLSLQHNVALQSAAHRPQRTRQLQRDVFYRLEKTSSQRLL